MDRRSFLTLNSSRKAAPVKAARTFTGISPYTGTWGTAQVVHLLKRAMFGAAPADVSHFAGMSMNQAVDALLVPNAATP
ncbi:hypothetical protein, partial [Chitinophaga sp.]|uniref:hypothetical protein n=1 Tax=Chitinophaga sp. TaxID=1869181 RepID=UPI002617381A